MNNYVLYLIIASVTIASPGPGVLLTVSNSLRHGFSGAIRSILGVAAGILIVAVVSATGLGLMLAASAMAFSVIKYIGAAYLVWLGIKLWRSPAGVLGPDMPENESRGGRFVEGISITLLNPKAIFFFMSLFPQFIDHSAAYAGQFALLSLSYCVLVVIIHSVYALGAKSIRGWVATPRGNSIVKKVAGGAFMAFGAALATSGR